MNPFAVIGIIILLVILFVVVSSDNNNKGKNDILYKMFSNHDISQATFIKYLNKVTDKKSMLISMIENNEIDKNSVRKYWDM